MKIKNGPQNQFRDIPDPMIPKSMQDLEPAKWEYKTLYLPRHAGLSEYGFQGWELVAVIPRQGDMATFYFIRPKESS